MANPTTNYGWVMPTSTDLVTDLPADFAVFGQAVDTSMADLKGGTTGQVLAKASNTDMDFVWSADAAGMTNPMTTTGDTIYSSSGSTPARRAIGTTGQVLTVSGGIPVWSTPTVSTPSYSLLGTGTTTSGSTVTVSGISGINSIYILLQGVSSASSSQPQVNLRINGDTGANYNASGIENIYSTSYSSNDFNLRDGSGSTSIKLGNYSTNAGSIMRGGIIIEGCNSSGLKMITTMTATDKAGGAAQYQMFTVGSYSGTSTVSSVSLIIAGTTFDAGDFLVYGSA